MGLWVGGCGGWGGGGGGYGGDGKERHDCEFAGGVENGGRDGLDGNLLDGSGRVVGWLVGGVRWWGGSAWVDGWGKLDEGETERRSKKVAKTHDFRCIVVDVG